MSCVFCSANLTPLTYLRQQRQQQSSHILNSLNKHPCTITPSPAPNLKLAMAEFKSNDVTANSLPDGKAKEEIEATSHPQKSPCHHSRETRGLNNNIDENTSLDDVRAPNVFKRAKEEFQALAQVFHHKKEPTTHDTKNGNQMPESKHKQEIPSSLSETKVKPSTNLLVRAKEEIKAIIHRDNPQHIHHKETHGRTDDIDENTPTNEVKGPSVFERVKEEFEAVFQAIHPKKES